MVFKELEIQGFKSFPDKVKISFDTGVTGVVGPNGSGKSNLSDAVRWVLGETSSRQLRAAGKMEDVIFGGTRKRSPMGFAQVRLTLDNAAHTLDVDADEVTIGRKYYRSGDSEYTINGQVCRLRDVYELLLDTGIGRDGYSVIGQGRIAEIVAAKSSERREIFEEACGIAKYRYRKTEAERRLAAAGENLERLRDILGELESRVGPLEKESAKAQKFLELSAQRKTMEVTLWTDGVHRAREAVRQQVRDYETAQTDYERFDRETKAAEQEAEEIRMQAQQLTVAVERLNGDIRSITQQISGSESRIAVLENDILRNDESATSLQQEIAAGQQDTAEADAALQRHRAVAKTMEAAGEKLAAEIEALNTELARLADASTASGARKDSLRAELADCTAKRTEAQVAQAAAEAAGDTARQRLPALEQSARDAAAQLEETKQDLADTVKYRQTLEENEKQLGNIRSGLELKLRSRKAALDEADAAEQRLGRELDAARQRLSVLRELEKNMDGYQNSVRAVMRAAGARRLRGVLGPVSTILKVESGCEVAIETALGGALQNIVVENEAAAKAAIALLRNDHAGRATFLPLDTVQGSRFNGRLTGTAEVAADLVETAPQYQHIIDNLLGRIIVVEDLGEASVVAKNLGYRNRIVTMDGQVINAGGSFTGGSTARSVGVFSRKQELDELRAKVLKLDERRAAAEKEAAARKAEVDNLTAQLAGAESEGMTAAAARLKAEMELDQLNTALEEGKNAAAHRGQEIAALEQQLRENTAAAAQAENARKQAEAEIETHRKELESLGTSTSDVTRQREEASQKLSDNRMQKLRTEKDLSLHEAALETLKGRSGEAEARVRELQANVAAAKERIAANELRANEIKRAREENKQKITAAEETIRKANAERMEKEAAVTRLTQENRTLTDERERMSGEMARLAERKTAAETELNTTASKLWEEYQLTEAEAEKLCVPFANVADLRRQVAEVRGKIRALGNVNVGAIEEYKEVKERYDFMKAQVTDVEKSRAELNRMIAELCSEMQEMFTASFKEINRNFGAIFRELFGGGSARLYLSDENDVLNSGIEIQVSPPGKVIKNLSALSGGEQALVAISIYFAILAVNPSPFCILDEIEAALDDVNVTRYAQYLRRMTERTQFIVITHRRGTMEAADVLYGVTMQEDGVSKILRLDLENVSADLIS